MNSFKLPLTEAEKEGFMNRTGSILLVVFLTSVALAGNVFGAIEYASMSVSPGEIVWHPLVGCGGVTLTVSGPSDTYIRKEYGAGASPSVGLIDDSGSPLPAGQYSYELVFAPASGTMTRPAGDPAGTVGIDPMVQSGGFRILSGQFVTPNTIEEPDATRDAVVADDQIVQGSLCVGLDCVNGETFGFDTIRLKENNTRVVFNDTSTSAGFPNRSWRLRANDSASGGKNAFFIDDLGSPTTSWTGTDMPPSTPFAIIAGAPNNSLYVNASGRVGFRTSTPVLDLHVNSTDTPALRLEQNNSGGWTAQTWDVAGNEANFFVRDLTGGSKLPFRIRPGAPTSSIDISASGKVGVGTTSPLANLHVYNSTVTAGTTPRGIISAQHTADGVASAFIGMKARGSATVNNGDYIAAYLSSPYDGSSWLQTAGMVFVVNGAVSTGAIPTDLILQTGSATRTEQMRITSAGNVGIGTSSPTHKLQVCGAGGCAYNEGGTTWVNASSREYKENIAPLTPGKAMETLQGLSPVTFTYKGTPDQSRVGFIAEDVPGLVAMKDRKGLSPMDIVAVLTKVVQEQGRMIEELKGELAKLKGVESPNIRNLNATHQQ